MPAPLPSRRRSWRRIALWLGVMLLLAMIVAVATIDRWLMAAMRPGPFDRDATPPAPDYRALSSWAAHPDVEDGSDVVLPEAPGLAEPADAKADVFYVHPTTAISSVWNAPIDAPEVVEATHRGGTLIQASAFNACCAVYGPRYRQAHGHALTHPDEDGRRALEVAYADVSAAFDAFLDQTEQRPFLVAGHSQGTMLASRLIRERISDSPLRERLVVAYLIGGSLRPDDLGGLPVCETADQTGCVVAWNARGPEYRPNGLELDAEDPDTMKGRICVNPLTWSTDGVHAPASAHPGALFFDTPEPSIQAGFADAQCIDGALVITEMGDPQRDFMSGLLLWMMGPDNYHPMEIQLFYLPLRRNAVTRVEAFVAEAPVVTIQTIPRSVLVVAARGPAEPRTAVLDPLERSLLATPGVRHVARHGRPSWVVTLELDPARLRALGLETSMVTAAMQRALTEPSSTALLHARPSLDIDALGDVVLATHGETSVVVKDVASITYDRDPEGSRAWSGRSEAEV